MDVDAPMTLADLFPDLPAVGCRYRIDVTITRGGRNAAPAEDQAIADLAAVILSARGLVTGWTSAQSALSMVVDARDCADALAVGAEVVRALGAGAGGASVSVERAETTCR
jgi:hypothetical protein